MKRYKFSSGDEETSRRAEQQFLRITENMTDEQRDAVLECLIKKLNPKCDVKGIFFCCLYND